MDGPLVHLYYENTPDAVSGRGCSQLILAAPPLQVAERVPEIGELIKHEADGGFGLGGAEAMFPTGIMNRNGQQWGI